MVRPTYAEKTDLLKGDMPLAAQYGDGTRLLEMAADDIDAELGHIYVTPIVVEDLPVNKPSILLLKKINYLLASGRLIMDMALGGEDNNLNAYGASLYREGRELLQCLKNKDWILTGVTEIPTEAARANTGPMILQEDEFSLVSSFYQQTNPYTWRATVPPAAPYSLPAYVPPVPAVED